MKKSEMVCKTCIKFDGEYCRMDPIPWDFQDYQGQYDPATHWCAQGEWHDGAERGYSPSRGIEVWWPNSLSWGEWEINGKGEPL